MRLQIPFEIARSYIQEAIKDYLWREQDLLIPAERIELDTVSLQSNCIIIVVRDAEKSKESNPRSLLSR